MCIRDRFKGTVEVKDGSLIVNGKTIRVTAEKNPADLKWGAVSYTHLRAHETVLDLVCRLLLEKKKLVMPAAIILVPSYSLSSYCQHVLKIICSDIHMQQIQ